MNKIMRNTYSDTDDDYGHQSSLFHLVLAILQKQSESDDSLQDLAERFADIEESIFEIENSLKELTAGTDKDKSEPYDIMSDDVMF